MRLKNDVTSEDYEATGHIFFWEGDENDPDYMTNRVPKFNVSYIKEVTEEGNVVDTMSFPADPDTHEGIMGDWYLDGSWGRAAAE